MCTHPQLEGSHQSRLSGDLLLKFWIFILSYLMWSSERCIFTEWLKSCSWYICACQARWSYGEENGLRRFADYYLLAPPLPLLHPISAHKMHNSSASRWIKTFASEDEKYSNPIQRLKPQNSVEQEKCQNQSSTNPIELFCANIFAISPNCQNNLSECSHARVKFL